MVFDGVNDYVDCGSINLMNKITVSCWIKVPNVTKNRVFVSKWKTGAETDNSYLLFIDDTQLNKVNFAIFQSNNTLKLTGTSNTSITPNQWINAVGVADGTNVLLYINGILQTNMSTYDGTIKQTTRETLIGKLRIEDTVYIFDGSQNYINVYDYALTSNEISYNFNALRNKYGI
jgi:hypothetical protein